MRNVYLLELYQIKNNRWLACNGWMLGPKELALPLTHASQLY